MISFSCADFTFPTLPHEKTLQLIKMMGFESTDVGLFQDRSHLQPNDQLKEPEKNGKKLFSAAKNAGLIVDDIFLQSSLDFREFAINHPSKAIRDRERDGYRRIIDFTLASGAKHFTGLPGTIFDKDSLELAAQELKWRVDYANEHGVVYSVEPSHDSVMSSPKDTLDMLAKVPGLTLALDYSHYIGHGYKNEEIHPLLNHASLLHARGAANGRIQTAFEDNEIDYDAIVDHLLKIGYDGVICLEFCYLSWENLNRVDTISETLKLRQYIADILGIEVLRTDYACG